MPNRIEIENIEERRRQAGIDDVVLQGDIRALHVGDLVKLTLLTPTESCVGETVEVRITSIRGRAFRGKLLSTPSSPDLANLEVGALVAFTTAHIHSLRKGKPTPAPGRSRGGSRAAATTAKISVNPRALLSGASKEQPARTGRRPVPGRLGPALPRAATPVRAPRVSMPSPSSLLIGPSAEGTSMITKPYVLPRLTSPRPGERPPRAPRPVLPATAGDRLLQIEAMGQRINGYVQFMCQVGGLNGTSDEAKEQAIAAFHERMVVLEGELARIQEELQLG